MFGQETTATITATSTLTAAATFSDSSSKSTLQYDTAKKLTGIPEDEIVRINEGLRKDSLQYRSVLGTEDDSLFVIVTKTYFRVAYPQIFSKEEKK